MDSRIYRTRSKNVSWYDVDFPDVIKERRRYYAERLEEDWIKDYREECRLEVQFQRAQNYMDEGVK